VVEYDLSGVVVNPNGTTFAVGDEVVGIIPADVNMKTANGAMCQWTVVKVRIFLSLRSSSC
jgi:NADPH:quinone reductase-like Zn-dependent oxidoreductase